MCMSLHIFTHPHARSPRDWVYILHLQYFHFYFAVMKIDNSFEIEANYYIIHLFSVILSCFCLHIFLFFPNRSFFHSIILHTLVFLIFIIFTRLFSDLQICRRLFLYSFFYPFFYVLLSSFVSRIFCSLFVSEFHFETITIAISSWYAYMCLSGLLTPSLFDFKVIKFLLKFSRLFSSDIWWLNSHCSIFFQFFFLFHHLHFYVYFW